MIDISVLCTFTLTVLLVLLLTIFLKFYSSSGYFSQRNIPYEKQKGVFGSGGGSASMPLLLWDLYRKGRGHRMYGFFIMWKPNTLIRDLEIIKHVLVKSFTNFYDRGVYLNEEKEPLSGHLFALEGETWKRLRAKLSPAFTSGRMKLMFPTITGFGDKLVSYIAEKPHSEPLECFHLTAKYTLSNIASTAFGIESDIFEDDSKFMEMALKFNTPSLQQLLRSFFFFQLRGLAKILPFNLFPQDVSEFFLQLTQDAFTLRQKNNITRNDFLQMLIQLKEKGFIENPSENDAPLTMNQLTAQAFVFILGGFETSALAQSWALYELALHPDVQQRLQAEVDSVDSWTYENILGLPYLDMVFNETLRKYPSVPFIIRKCNEDFRVPDSDVVIEKGSEVSISVCGLHRDPDLFPDPDEFDPERFHPTCPSHEVKPYSYLPFGEGPRFCIGMRFAKMQVKVGLATLMKHYSVEVSERQKVPAELHPYTFQLVAKDGLWLKFTRRTSH